MADERRKKYFVQAVLTEVEYEALKKAIDPYFFKTKIVAGEISRKEYVYNTLVFDYDNTVVDYPYVQDGVGKIKEKFKKAAILFKQRGIKLGILTARPDEFAGMIKQQMKEEGIPIDFVQYNPKSEWVSHKPEADLYIDDRGFRHLGNWEKDYNTIIDLLDSTEDVL